ncbi:MAG: FkbM family methyltransferase [Clostridia bacterium]|nr:FkbM family methyltransferase [Clostridia bacterium]
MISNKAEKRYIMIFDDLLSIKEDVWTHLYNTEKPIVMYGTGNGADKIIDVLEEKGIKLYGIFASDDFARDRSFRGFKVKKYADFKVELGEFIVIVSFASQRNEVLSNIYRIASEQELYAPDVPVFGSGLFDMEYFKAHKERLELVYDMLSDDVSRNTFVCSLAFKITGNIDYLRSCEVTESECDSLVSRLLTSRNYVDIGAYTGDTVEKYVSHHGNDIEIYAFEPDEKNYRKMLERFESRGIRCNTVNAAAWDKTETLRFYSNSGRAGSADKGRNSTKFKDINAVRAEDYIDKEIGFVKIDAEGSDANALRGLASVIRKDAPVMKVAAYHRNEDFFSIPEAVSEIKDGYRLYMRHLKYVPGWDTDFIFSFDC